MKMSEKIKSAFEGLVGFFDEYPVKGASNMATITICLMNLKEAISEMEVLDAGCDPQAEQNGKEEQEVDVVGKDVVK